MLSANTATNSSYDFTEGQLFFFRQFLKEHSGYNLMPGKEYLLDSRLKPVIAAHKFDGVNQIIQELQKEINSSLATDVIEAMTVNETFFFRDDKPFKIFKETIIPELVEICNSRPVKLWSAACSSGQEPYSKAILLEEAKLTNPQLRYSIDASDINNKVVQKAQQGQYTQNEIGRGLTPQQQEKYFNKTGEYDRQISNDLQKNITFFQHNLTQDPKPFKGPYDVVFLRNVLIYFEPELKKQVLEKVAKVMKPGSLLVLGVAENIYDNTLGFKREDGVTGIYRKG